MSPMHEHLDELPLAPIFALADDILSVDAKSLRRRVKAKAFDRRGLDEDDCPCGVPMLKNKAIKEATT